MTMPIETTLPKHLLAEVDPQAPAKIRRPQVAKQRFSRSAAQARREDGVDTTVTVRRIGVPAMTPAPLEFGCFEPLPEGSWSEFAMSACGFGCKVYREATSGQEAVAHNSAYGCRR